MEIRKFYDIEAGFSIASKGTGLRYNQGKLRYDLVQPWAHEQMVKILTKGAQKYAERNWEKGMLWSNVISSLKRHLAAIERGEDYDLETGELHAAHVACNAHFLTAYYKIFPQGDDRPHTYLNQPKIGLDIDEVLCDWLGAWRKLWNIKDAPSSWWFDRKIREKFKDMEKKGILDKFYSSLTPLIDPKSIPFEPHCYITSRPCSLETSVEWLDRNGFPTKPIHCVGVGQSKVEVAKAAGVDIFVDDSYDNFTALNNAGICCFLYSQPHNERYDVGFKRIHSLKELI
jgi:5'(3')-deoxyribonucleotidase